MENQTIPSPNNGISTGTAARITGLHHQTILKYQYVGKLHGWRESTAPQAPWRFDSNEVKSLKESGCIP